MQFAVKNIVMRSMVYASIITIRLVECVVYCAAIATVVLLEGLAMIGNVCLDLLNILENSLRTIGNGSR